MNLIRLSVDDRAVHLGGQTIKLPDRLARAVSDDGAREIILGIRPEHIAVRDGSGEGIPGKVVLVESLGADSYVHAAIDGTESKFVARTEGYDARRPGTNVRLLIDSARIYAFHPETEERIRTEGGNGTNGRKGAMPSVAAAS
jgi:multiple sugar transport system ATP-binding protein